MSGSVWQDLGALVLGLVLVCRAPLKSGRSNHGFEAKLFYERAINDGHEAARQELASLLERIGDEQGAGYLRLYGLDADGSPAKLWTLDYAGEFTR